MRVFLLLVIFLGSAVTLAQAQVAVGPQGRVLNAEGCEPNGVQNIFAFADHGATASLDRYNVASFAYAGSMAFPQLATGTVSIALAGGCRVIVGGTDAANAKFYFFGVNGGAAAFGDADAKPAWAATVGPSVTAWKYNAATGNVVVEFASGEIFATIRVSDGRLALVPPADYPRIRAVFASCASGVPTIAPLNAAFNRASGP